MSIMLGDLTVSQIEQRLGIKFPKEIQDFMTETHQPSASNIAKGRWHCFDTPFNLVCGDVDVATKIYNSVRDKSAECKVPLQLSIQN